MAKTSRRYSERTLKLLFAGSGNQCAEPTCTNPIIAPQTRYSPAAVLGQICHIYAAADDGPRGKPGLTEKARNAPENLILMCGFHHPLVDKQWETYPADLLIGWKKHHEAKYQRETAEAAQLQAHMQRLAFVQAYSDQQIRDEVEKIRKCRFLADFPSKDRALALATRVDATELSGGSSEVRARALAWCARILSNGDTIGEAKDLLSKSRRLGDCEEAELAEAFLLSLTDKDLALAKLATVDTPAARSAALRIVTHQDTAEAAIKWAALAGLSLTDFDAEGRCLYLMNQLLLGEWEAAQATVAAVTDEDFEAVPVLYDPVGMATLMQAVPEELRASLLGQLPFELASFPLASDEHALEASDLSP